MKRPIISIFMLGISVSFSLRAQNQIDSTVAGRHSSQALTDAHSAVKGFFPEDLVDPDYPDDRPSCFGIYESAPNGSGGSIVAVYPSARQGIRGEMWLLTRASSGQYSPQRMDAGGLDLSGDRCSVDIVDIGRGNGLAIKVSLMGNDPVAGDYLFSWDGIQLKTLTPTIRRGLWSLPAISNASLVHLFPDGALALVSTDSTSDDDRAPLSVYRLVHGAYTLESHGVYLRSFACNIHWCDNITDNFVVGRNSRGPYSLRLGNGERSGEMRADTIQVVVNDVNVIEESKFGADTDSVSIPLSNLHVGQNSIHVALTLRADNEPEMVYLLLEDHTR